MRLFLAVLFCSLTFALPAAAQDDRPTAIVVTWTVEATGKWHASGPVQNTWSQQDTEAEAIDLVENDSDRPGGNRPRFLGQVGRFKIYTLDRPLVRGETDPRRRGDLVEKIKEETGYDLTDLE